MNLPRHFFARGLVACTLLSFSGVARAALSADEQKIVAAVDRRAGELGGDLEAAVQIDSVTENVAGVRRMADHFGQQLTELGFEYRFAALPASTGRAGHLVAERRGTRGQRLLLIGHLDTVLRGGNFAREGNEVRGAGVNDIKGGDVVLIHALRALHAAGALADTRIIVVMTGDEESPGDPVEVSRRELLEAAKRSDVALAFEGAIGQTATVARRGSVKWELEVQGATGHSSGIFSAAMGSGAVFEAARILTAFYQELRSMEGMTFNPALVVGGTEATLTRTGGTAVGKTNVIPQRTLVQGDIRCVSAEQLAEAKARMAAIVARSLPRTSATLKFSGDGYPAMPPSPENYALLGRLGEVSRDLGFGPVTAFDPRGRGAGDIAFVSPPLPALDGLGLRGDGAHSPREVADLASAPELIKRAAILIHRLTR